MKHFLLFAMLFSTGMYADGHTDAEATVLKNIVDYWDARNDRCLLYTSDAADEE